MKVTISYEIVTEESAEYGDAAERGWEDEDGIEFDSIGELIEYLDDNGPMEPSSSFFHENVWYTGPVIHDRNYFEKGEHKTLSYFVKDATLEEQETIYRAVVLGEKHERDLYGSIKP